MIGFTITMILAFYWLLIETDWMRVRLPVGASYDCLTSIGIEQTNKSFEQLREEYAEQQLARVAKEQADNRKTVEKAGGKWQFSKYGNDAVMSWRVNPCGLSNSCRECRKDDKNWFGWRIPARTVKVCGSTINFKAGCNLYRAKLLKDIVKAQKSKAMPTYHKKNEGSYIYNGKYNKGWFKTDELAQLSIELLVDGKSVASINGNYKHGMIKTALKPYTTKARVGKHTVTWDFGEADRVTANK